MDELLKLSVEELEHILAVAPYSEMHQMAYAIKKNRHDTGSMYQVIEGNYHHIKLKQEKITRDIIKGHAVSTISEAAPQEPVVFPLIEKADSPVIQKETEKPAAKREFKEPVSEEGLEFELIESKEMNLVGDVSSFIIPDKTKAGKKKKKPKKKKEKKQSIEVKKKKKKKSKKEKKKSKKQQKTTSESMGVEDDLTGLSDFSAWLLAHSKESHIHPLQDEEKKKKKKKSKKEEKKKKKNKDLISEPLADLLARQGHLDQAREMYEKLSLIFPEKSAFFAAKIENIQKEK